MTTHDLAIRDLLPGDQFAPDGTLHYTVWAPPARVQDEYHVRVQYADGGISTRAFDLDAKLTVRRSS